MSNYSKCPNGHLYDPSSNKQCPFCAQKGMKGLSSSHDLFADISLNTSPPECSPPPREEIRTGEWREDTSHCPQCQSQYLDSDDKYCRFCGSERTGAPGRYFFRYPEFIECVYGPMPVTLYYSCPHCGNQWQGSNWNEQRYCPSCGTRVSGSEQKPSSSVSLKIRLTMVDDDHFFAEYTVREQKTSFGRGEVSDVVLNKNDRLLSRVHFSLVIEENELYICDLGSTNGTLVNDELLSTFGRTRLQSGDVITAGHHAYRITF